MKRHIYNPAHHIGEDRRHGAMLVMVVVSIVIFLVFTTFAVDVSYMQLTRTELRSASDAASRAGAEALARTQDKDLAVAAAIAVAAANKVAGKPMILTEDDIEVGRSDRQDDGSWTFTANATPFNALRVNSGFIEGNANGEINLFFGHMLGKGEFAPVKQSTAAHLDNEVCFVIDRSHSMCFDHTGSDWSYPAGIPLAPPDPVIWPPHPTGSRWASLEDAVELYLNTAASLDTPHRIGMVSFGSWISPWYHYEGWLTGRSFPSVATDSGLTTDHDVILDAIHDRGDDVMLGGTALSLGIDRAVTVLTGPDVKKFANRTMIVFTDGAWNSGEDPALAAARAKAANITIHTVTFMSGADQSDMAAVARITGGRHFHADNTAELETVFRELALTLPVVITE